MTDLLGKHDPGGRRLFPLPPGVHGRAAYGGPADCYRYLAEYWVADDVPGTWSGPSIMVVGMNPSTATDKAFDPTIAKLWRLARKWGYGRLFMTNAFAYRCTDQRRLVEVEDPVGPDNPWWLRECARQADLILMACGTPQIARLRDAGPAVADFLVSAGYELHALRVSQSGRPCHPLYLPEHLTPQPWAPNA